MKSTTEQLIKSKIKEDILRASVFNNPLVWRIIVNYFKDKAYIPNNELINFFKLTINKKCKGDLIKFIKANLDEFKVINKNKLRPSLLSLERKFMDLQYTFKKTISSPRRYPSYFDVFMKAEVDDIDWMVYMLLGEFEKKTGITEYMINKIIKEVTDMEYEKDAVITISMMNKETNQIVGMDMVISKTILNLIMKEKVHKEFDKILKDTVDKLSTVKNINKLLYS